MSIHKKARIGEAPQMRDWEHGDPNHGVELGEDVEIGAYSCVDGGYDSPTRIGRSSWIMKQVHVGHDCQIGERVEVGSMSALCGYVHIGDDTHLGLGVTVLPFRKIGKRCTIGAGSVVTKNVPDGETWAGNPARSLEPNPVPFTDREDLAMLEYARHYDDSRAEKLRSSDLSAEHRSGDFKYGPTRVTVGGTTVKVDPIDER